MCFFYAVSGALNYREEAISEAKMALWKCCCRFDPAKQRMQVKQQKIRTEEILLSCIFGYTTPADPSPVNSDPYKNFWISSLTRIRGSVLDYFRAERLIIKPVITGELSTLTRATIKKIKNRIGVDDDDDIALQYGISVEALQRLKPTMLHQERFLSLDRSLGDASGGSDFGREWESFYEIIASSSKTDQGDEVQHIRFVLLHMKAKALLSSEEEAALDYFYSEAGYNRAEIAGLMKITTAKVKNLIEDAIIKMRGAAFPVSISST